MTAKQFAAKLNGREMGWEINVKESKDARAAGLIVIFGYSDDNIELRGVIDDAIGAGDKTTIYLHQGGVLEHADYIDCKKCQADARAKQRFCRAIKCKFGTRGYSWWIEPKTPDMPFAPFDILEGDDKFCRGIVISASDLPKI